MIPYSYNMVDMGGIDLAEANGTVVEGLYNRLALARNACGDLILFNWKFAEIEIAPAPCSTLDEGTSILINGLIQVTEQDEVTVLGIEPPPPPIEPVEPLIVDQNGVYEAEPPISGFNPVTVNVEGSPIVNSSLAIVDGEYVYENLSTPGTPYIKDGNFGAIANQALTFVAQLSASVEMEFDFWPTTVGRTLSFGGSNTSGGLLAITTTSFYYYASGTRFSVPISPAMEEGIKYHILLKIYADRIELYVDGELNATGISSYSVNIINRILQRGSIRLLQNQSASAEYSTATMNNILIKVKGE